MDGHASGAQVEDERAHDLVLAEGQGLDPIGGLRPGRKRNALLHRGPGFEDAKGRMHPVAFDQAFGTRRLEKGDAGEARLRGRRQQARRPRRPEGRRVAGIGGFRRERARCPPPGPQGHRRQAEGAGADEGPRAFGEGSQALEVLDEGRVVERVHLRVQGEGHLIELGRRGPGPVQLGEVRVGASAESGERIDGQKPATRLGHETVGGRGGGLAKDEPDPHPRLVAPRHPGDGRKVALGVVGEEEGYLEGQIEGAGFERGPGQVSLGSGRSPVEVDPEVVEAERPQMGPLRFRERTAEGGRPRGRSGATGGSGPSRPAPESPHLRSPARAAAGRLR